MNRKDEMAHEEWLAWREVCERLVTLGAVTKEDLTATATERNTTGQELFFALRAWGDRLAILRIADYEDKRRA